MEFKEHELFCINVYKFEAIWLASLQSAGTCQMCNDRCFHMCKEKMRRKINIPQFSSLYRLTCQLFWVQPDWLHDSLHPYYTIKPIFIHKAWASVVKTDTFSLLRQLWHIHTKKMVCPKASSLSRLHSVFNKGGHTNSNRRQFNKNCNFVWKCFASY